MFGLGFSSGIPFLLVYVTQSAWLSEAKVPLAMLGLMSELTLAYKFKFVWAPFLNHYDAPVFSRLLGRRRGWIIVSQIGVALALAGVAFGDPAQLARLDGRLLPRARLRRRDAGYRHRRLAHHGRAARSAQGLMIVLGGDRLAHRQSCRRRRRALPRRRLRLARRLSLHGGAAWRPA